MILKQKITNKNRPYEAKGVEKGITHKRRLCLDESTGLLPVTISKRRTPKANTSVFSSTKPCMKYSGAKYPNVPSIGTTAWCVHLFGSHFASPKSVICLVHQQNLDIMS